MAKNADEGFMGLPLSAARRAIRPLTTSLPFPIPQSRISSLSLSGSLWNGYLGMVQQFSRRIVEIVSELNLGSFHALRAQAEELHRTRWEIYARLSSLSPFAPFTTIDLESILEPLNALAGDIDELIAGDKYRLERTCASVSAFADSLPFLEESAFSRIDALRMVFKVEVDLLDDHGDFRAEWVLAEYAYRADELFEILFRHLRALGIPFITDQLAATAIVGGIVSSHDPVLSFDIMASLAHTCARADEEVTILAMDYLRRTFATRQSTLRAIDRAMRNFGAAETLIEDRALVLAETYRRILEGPFRHYVWSYECLKRNEWREPPTVGPMTEQVGGGDGIYAGIVKEVVLRDLRNGAAHETLYWDGIREVLIAEGVSIRPIDIAQALGLMIKAIQGSEVGWALCRASRLSDGEPLLPLSQEPNRMPDYDRVRAFFGTNNLRLLGVDFNRRDVIFRIERLNMTDINPAFQALLLAQRLLPDASEFKLLVGCGEEPVISISKESIAHTLPVWEYAIENIDRMPFSVFLPMNYEARLHLESKSAARRSVAWIAVDDLLDAIDGSPAIWGQEEIRLLRIRLSIVERAVIQVQCALADREFRLKSVLESVREIRDWFTSRSFARAEEIEGLESLQRVRGQWAVWGPVPRHPGVEEIDLPVDWPPIMPKRRERPTSSHYRTI